MRCRLGSWEGSVEDETACGAGPLTWECQCSWLCGRSRVGGAVGSVFRERYRPRMWIEHAGSSLRHRLGTRCWAKRAKAVLLSGWDGLAGRVSVRVWSCSWRIVQGSHCCGDEALVICCGRKLPFARR